MKKYLTISNPFLILTIIFAALLIFQILIDNDWANKLSAGATAVAALGGILLMIFTFQYLQATRGMVAEMQKQNEPAITVKITPGDEDRTLLYVWIKNVGNSAAYNIKIEFDPDLPYREGTLNSLPGIKRLTFMERGEETYFFYTSTLKYFANINNPRKTTVSLKYYSSPNVEDKAAKEFNIKYEIDLNENERQLFIIRKNMHNLVEEVSELKKGILMLIAENREGRNKNE